MSVIVTRMLFANLRRALKNRSLVASFRKFALSTKPRSFAAFPEYLWPADLPPSTEWGYNKAQGPETWTLKYPQAGGQHQSPIDIATSSVQSVSFDEPLQWRYGQGICKSLLNTGCGWRLDIAGHDTELHGGPLSHTYELAQFHCHWNDDSGCGSEHTVDGTCYAGELHFVHWNKHLFQSCAEAVPAANGLTVIGVFLEVGEANSEIEKLCEAIKNIPFKDQRVDLPSDIDPVLMFPADHSYWTYEGSLTTPPCYESVTWIIFKNPISVTEEQLNCFREMKKCCEAENHEEHSCVSRNYRPTQSLNDRQIFECSG